MEQQQGRKERPVGRYGPDNQDEWARSEKIADQASSTYDAAMEQMAESENPISDAGKIAGQTIRAMELDIEAKTGRNIEDRIAEGAFVIVTQDLVEMAVKAGFIPAKSQEEVNAALEGAFRVAGKVYADAVMQEQEGQQGQSAGVAQEQPQQPQQPQPQAPPAGMLGGGGPV